MEIKTYGDQAAKDIRAIGRSYAYTLTNKQTFTDFIIELKETATDGGITEVRFKKSSTNKLSFLMIIILVFFILVTLNSTTVFHLISSVTRSSLDIYL